MKKSAGAPPKAEAKPAAKKAAVPLNKGKAPPAKAAPVTSKVAAKGKAAAKASPAPKEPAAKTAASKPAKAAKALKAVAAKTVNALKAVAAKTVKAPKAAAKPSPAPKKAAAPKKAPVAKKAEAPAPAPAPKAPKAAKKAKAGAAAEGGDSTPASEGLDVGDSVPDLSLLDQDGEELSLASLKGQAYVLYFYPKDDTPGCTREACTFRDDMGKYDGAKVRVIGVSPDKPESHVRFREKYGLPFTLLSDTEKKAANAFGVWVKKQNYGREYMGIQRSTFLVDEAGKVKKVWRNVKVDGHSQSILDATS